MIEAIPYVICNDGFVDASQISALSDLQTLNEPPTEGAWLEHRNGSLCLFRRDGRQTVTSSVDFTDPALLHRLNTSGKRQGIGQAIGLNKYASPTVIDCTGGLGRDAFIMAGLGCSVTMLERHPVIFALLQDGLNRGRLSDNEQVRSICSNLSLVKTNARDWLHELSAESKPDVIYMDPMFPQRSKSAKVKKAISGLQNLAGEDNDYLEVLTEAVKNAGKRVVVKRPAGKSDDWLKDILTPDFEITGKTIRFCVFLPRN